jgi:hypothetical protein
MEHEASDTDEIEEYTLQATCQQARALPIGAGSCAGETHTLSLPLRTGDAHLMSH